MEYLVRPVKADEWKRLRELRLAALADPVSRIAFNESFEKVAAYPDDVWQRRAAQSDEDQDPLTFIGEGPDGSWGGMVVVLVEKEGADERDGEEPWAHIVGVYVRPEHRGTGLARDLFGAAVGWAWSRSEPAVERVRLWVHEENERAAALYRSLGFVETGRTMTDPKGGAAIEREMALERA
ncbi:GCN5-related N-acetyltransferase [Streptomyces sp. CB02923]|uniref:GNAT family N-acetyltransferase n=1 Tax=Streptomyces sp. CB02923 TaxID=1718985 RepID=UPI00094056F2|nr:N-acetyltransferase [Streptomyces sp. CB02923]OKI10188.1 GCN5-related N-acetyltransferase [Streptomyces sp. CB02923]